MNVRPKRSLGQNFLSDDSAAGRIAERLELKKDDTVLEIGAGKGALTRHLVEKANRVLAVEIDARLCRLLRKSFRDVENLSVINEDILKLDFRDVVKPGAKVKAVGNLPYQITSPVLSFLLENKETISLCVLTVQKEMALRICALPGTKDWSPLSIAVQLHSDARVLFHLKPESFYPPPKVDSSVIKITFLGEPRVAMPDEEWFFKVVRCAFSQRRKMVSNSLAGSLDLPKSRIEVILEEVGIDPRKRAEALGLKQFVDLASAMREILK
ncbi:MAG: ribosomal RNA small subunit methyltransferase A [Candidatus Zixiibacteriota bacterium]|nr:MAG: ribosomal RNA small subunit methyltransferase A [candidate division Zixibacteria bacterium]